MAACSLVLVFEQAFVIRRTWQASVLLPEPFPVLSRPPLDLPSLRHTAILHCLCTVMQEGQVYADSRYTCFVHTHMIITVLTVGRIVCLIKPTHFVRDFLPDEEGREVRVRTFAHRISVVLFASLAAHLLWLIYTHTGDKRTAVLQQQPVRVRRNLHIIIQYERVLTLSLPGQLQAYVPACAQALLLQQGDAADRPGSCPLCSAVCTPVVNEDDLAGNVLSRGRVAGLLSQMYIVPGYDDDKAFLLCICLCHLIASAPAIHQS